MEGTRPKAFVFVLMPFDESFRDVYEVGIKAACKDAGAYCERVDEQIFVESILERVYNQIAKADVIVAEMTGRNPNVFYEVGYAHALGKQVILLTQNSEDIPFDLKHYPHIIYGGKIAALKSQLEARVHWCIENPMQFLTKVDWHLEILVNGVSLQGAPRINMTHVSELGSEFFTDIIEIGVHNPTNRMISRETFDLALVVPPGVEIIGGGARSAVLQADGSYVCNLQRLPSVFPDGWESFCLRLEYWMQKGPINLILRLYKEVGREDYPFVLVPASMKDESSGDVAGPNPAAQADS